MGLMLFYIKVEFFNFFSYYFQYNYFFFISVENSTLTNDSIGKINNISLLENIANFSCNHWIEIGGMLVLFGVSYGFYYFLSKSESKDINIDKKSDEIIDIDSELKLKQTDIELNDSSDSLDIKSLDHDVKLDTEICNSFSDGLDHDVKLDTEICNSFSDGLVITHEIGVQTEESIGPDAAYSILQTNIVSQESLDTISKMLNSLDSETALVLSNLLGNLGEEPISSVVGILTLTRVMLINDNVGTVIFAGVLEALLNPTIRQFGVQNLLKEEIDFVFDQIRDLCVKKSRMFLHFLLELSKTGPQLDSDDLVSTMGDVYNYDMKDHTENIDVSSTFDLLKEKVEEMKSEQEGL